MKRLNQILLIASFIPFCWLAFMACHELGHVVTGLGTGGTIKKVVIHPLAISRTDVSPNPSPQLVAWGGPIFGVLVPILIWQIVRRLNAPGVFMAQFLAGFCLIANGAYIAFGSFGQIGDAGDMLRAGSANWMLWLFGIVTVPFGIFLWNGLGPKFGLGEAQGEVDTSAVYLSLSLFAITFLLAFCLSPRF